MYRRTLKPKTGWRMLEAGLSASLLLDLDIQPARVLQSLP
jgi:hypothetical protein